ncbi:DUF2085 domain-containing protein [bacterium]|nr:DUF2085 domain-containing protein [bacterium]
MRITIVAICACLIISAIWAPCIQTWNGYPKGEGTYSFLNNICHQYPTRCFWVTDRPVGLCSRCISGYLGLVIAATVIPMKRKYTARLAVGIGLVLCAIMDPLIQLNIVYESTNGIRLLTGGVGGIGVFNIINPRYSKPLIGGDRT